MAHPRQDGLLEAVSQIGAVIAALNGPFGDEWYDYHAAIVLSLCVRDKVNYDKAIAAAQKCKPSPIVQSHVRTIATLRTAGRALEADRIEMLREDEDPN